MKGILLGFALVAASALLHATSMVVIGEWLGKRRTGFESHVSVKLLSIRLSGIFGIVLLLHLAEITLWAIIFHSLGLLNGFATSLKFSFGSYTTNSAPDVQLPVEWELLGQLESITGALLIGLSTAFLFFVIQKVFEIRQILRGKKS